MSSGQEPTLYRQRTGQDTPINPTIEIAKNIIEGKPPSNDLLNQAIDSTKEVLDEEIVHRGTSAEVKLAKDAEAFLEVSKKLINEKNSNEQVQKFILESTEAAKELAEYLQNKAAQHQPELQQTAQEFSQQASDTIDSMKAFGVQIVESVEFRNLLNDMIDIVRHMIEEKKEQLPTPSLSEPLSSQLQQVGQAAQQLTNQIQEGELPVDEAKKQELVNSFGDVLRRVNASPDFKKAVQGMFHLFDQLDWALEEAKEELSKDQPQQNPHLRALFQEAREMVASWSGEENLDATLNQVASLYRSIKHNYALNKYFSEWKQLVTRLIENPALLQDDWNTRGEAELLYDEGLRWMNDPRYRGQLQALADSFQAMWDTIKDDELGKEFAQKTSMLAQDLIFDETGRPNLAVTLEGMNKFRTLLAPILRKNLETIPIAPFSGHNNTYDWEVQGLILNGRDIIPDQIQVRVWGDANVSLTDSNTKALTYITVWIRDIAVLAKDLRFRFHRKTFPQIDNKGIADIAITGDNWVKITWRIEGDQFSDYWNFSVQDIQCHIDKMKIKIKEATHNWLNKIISATLVGNMKRTVEKKVVQTLHEGLFTLGQQIDLQSLRSHE